MTTSNGPSDPSAARRFNRRTTTVYDRLEEARQRREHVLSQKPQPAPKPAIELPKETAAAERSAGVSAVVSSLKASAAHAEAPVTMPKASPSPVTEPASRQPRKQRAALIAVPALAGIAAVAFAIPTTEPDADTTATVAAVETTALVATVPTVEPREPAPADVAPALLDAITAAEPPSLPRGESGGLVSFGGGDAQPVRLAALGLEPDVLISLPRPELSSETDATAIVNDVPARGPEVRDAAGIMLAALKAAAPAAPDVSLPAPEAAAIARRSGDVLWPMDTPASPKIVALSLLPATVSVWTTEGALSIPNAADETGIRLAAFVAPGRYLSSTVALITPDALRPIAPGSQTPPEPLDLPPFTAAEDAAIRVVLHVPEKVSDARVAELQRAAEASGLSVDTLIRTPFSVSGTNIRYYHGTDLAGAEALAESLDARARDFTSFEPTPEPGLIEIYAEGKAAPRPRAQPQPSAMAAAEAPQQTRYRIIRITKPRRSFNPFAARSDSRDSDRSRTEVVTAPAPAAPGTTITELIAAASGSGDADTSGDTDTSGSTGNTGGTGGGTTGSTDDSTGGTTGSTGSTTGTTDGTTGTPDGTTGSTGGTTGSSGGTTGSTDTAGGTTGSTGGSTGSTGSTDDSSGGSTSGSSGGSTTDSGSGSSGGASSSGDGTASD